MRTAIGAGDQMQGDTHLDPRRRPPIKKIGRPCGDLPASQPAENPL
jgi:hypothetical protein